MLYKAYVLPALVYGIGDVCAPGLAALGRLAKAHNDYLRGITGMLRRPDSRYYPLRQLCQ